MKRRWLIFDTNYLCWRAHHTTGGLSYGGRGTGIIYGVLRDIVSLQELHGTNRIAFCFDSNWSFRKLSYPNYKISRRTKHYSEDQERAFKEVRRQITYLRKEVLPELGFKNIFQRRGYESDDLIASICETLPIEDHAIIISADHDLYQLLSHRVFLYNPTQDRAVTMDSFSREYGVSPQQWVDVKAIAGCSSDDVKGVKGVGEKTAAKFLNGTINNKSAAFKNIIANNKLWRKNKPIVKLPFAGCPKFELQKDKINPHKWERLLKRLGIKSLTFTGGSTYVKTKAEKRTRKRLKQRKTIIS